MWPTHFASAFPIAFVRDVEFDAGRIVEDAGTEGERHAVFGFVGGGLALVPFEFHAINVTTKTSLVKGGV